MKLKIDALLLANGLGLRRAVATSQHVEFQRKTPLTHASLSGDWL